MYFIIKGFLWLISCLPFRVLYVFSDILSFFLYTVFRYRRDIVFTHLTRAFPEKSKKELSIIEKKFYRYLGDMIVETLKSFSVSFKTLEKRMQYKNVHYIDNSFAQKRNIVVLGLHKGNWEWNSIVGTLYPDNIIATFYHPLHNEKANKMMSEVRSRFGVHLLTPALGFKKALEWKIKYPDKNFLIYMIADQSPTSDTKWHWTTFFNQEAPFMIGPELIAKKLDLDVYFLDHVRTKRGYYLSTIYPLSFDNKYKHSTYPLIEEYVRFCEQAIQKNPEHFLWTHRRWKHKPPQ